MGIKRVRISNFKTFKKIDVTLQDFNILIGSNASGKSNFLQIFKFIRDISQYGIENAISMQGGIDFLCNINIGPSEDLFFSIESDFFGRAVVTDKEQNYIGIKANEVCLEFALSFRRKNDFSINKDSIKFGCDFVKLERHQENELLEETVPLGSGTIKILKNIEEKKISISHEVPEGLVIDEKEFRPPFLDLAEIKFPTKQLLIETPYTCFPFINISGFFDSIAIYDFDPKLPKKAVLYSGKASLSEDGSNLAVVLKNLISKKRRHFLNMLKDILPYVKDVSVTSLIDKTVICQFLETYATKNLPASLLSDGTINVVAILLALYFQKSFLTVLEEPGRNVHPKLIEKLVDIIHDASKKKQILVTTHNAEIVKHADIKNLLLISRDQQGFSSISRPGEKKEVKIFLENQLGIEDIFVKGILD